MKARHMLPSTLPELIRTSLLSLVVLALAGACGGSTSSGGPTGGSAGNGGTTGASAGSGGRAVASAGTGITAGGSAGGATGGSAGSGGKSSGIGGELGCGSDPSTVHDGLPCERMGLQCSNACGTKCTCGGGLNWSCSDAATCGACPNTAPPAGTKCQGFTPGVTCQVGSSTCFCNSAADGSTEWQCVTCPHAKPTSGNTCSPAGLNCTYNTTCACYSDGTPSGGIWGCNDTPGSCPNAAPKNDSPCNDVGIQCPYLQEHGSCVCSAQHQWKCS